ncbi:hypothetical protein K7W42_12650 [Deinococcus sp. HMF7604]|uniref:hypothetical protein n=1 Tax=Deinococcus betulae TaxID=2873312 RepID=UPI001CC9BD3B|nr:hypothetical protein [Deinococcus betulae]MBZ9751712.1 hypothetical protein [Deinococcus betulae]
MTTPRWLAMLVFFLIQTVMPLAMAWPHPVLVAGVYVGLAALFGLMLWIHWTDLCIGWLHATVPALVVNASIGTLLMFLSL